MAKISLDTIDSVLNEDAGNSDQSPPPAAPKKLLQGSVTFTPEMEAKAAEMAKDIFPQPDDNIFVRLGKEAMAPAKLGGIGTATVPEDVVNAVGGTGQGVAQMIHPGGQQLTFGDLLRQVRPNAMSPNEFLRSQAFNQQANRDAYHRLLAQVMPTVGSFFVPVGEGANLLMKPAVQFMKDATPALQAGQKVQQIAQNVPEMMRVLKPMIGPRVRPSIAGLTTGGAYGTMFGAGQQFGQTRQMPSLKQNAVNASVGASAGLLLGHAVNQLQQLGLRQKIAQLAAQSPLAQLPQENAAPAMRDVLPSAPILKSNLQAMMYKNLARDTNRGGIARTDMQKATVQKRVFDSVQGRINAEGRQVGGEVNEEQQQALADALAAWEKEGLKQRQFEKKQTTTQAQTEERRGYSQQVRQQNVAQTAQHTDVSASKFHDFAARIDSAHDSQELRAIEDEIFTPGAGPKGQRLLDSAQQRKLQRRIQDRFSDLTPEEDQAGKSEGTPPGSPEVPPTQQEPPQNNPSSSPPASSAGETSSSAQGEAIDNTKTASGANPTEAPPVVPPKQSQPEATPKTAETTASDRFYAPVRSFIAGAFRKAINVKTYGSRADRYKFAVSPDALGRAAGLPQEKITALEKWVGKAAEMRREKTYKEAELARLVEWAYKHEDDWVGGRGKVSFERGEDGKTGAYHQLLTYAEREGRFKTLALRTRMERHFEQKTETNLEKIRVNLMKYGFQRAGEEPEMALKVDPKPMVSTTLNGIATKDAWQENADGSLHLMDGIKPIDLAAFVPPKNADELFTQTERLKRWISNFEHELSDVYHAQGRYDHLGDGTTPADVMQEAFQNLHVDWNAKGRPGAVPVVHVWHIDKASHVSTVRFDQPKSRTSWPDHMKDLEDKYRLVREMTLNLRGRDGKYDYDAIWASPKVLSGLTHAFTGLEVVPILSSLVGRQFDRLISSVSREVNLGGLVVGTIDDIMRGNARFGGDEVSQSLHGMLGEINAAFFNDKAGLLHPIKSAEELAEVLNEFKGVKVSRNTYRAAAKAESLRQGKTTVAEVSEAYKRADTAFMIRAKYQKLAKTVDAAVQEMNIRQMDSKSGAASAEGKRFYVNGVDLDDQGRVRRSAYDTTYHTALRELHKALTLQPGSSGSVAAFTDLAARKTMSIMANNPRVALKNLFDQAPITLAYFHKHFFTAAADLLGNAPVKEAISRLPVVPQADMSIVRMDEALKDDREPENAQQLGVDKYRRLSRWLMSLDPIFKGRAPLVSAADRMYTRVSALASLYKIAERYEIPRAQFVEDLMNGKFGDAETKAIHAEVSLDLTRVYNSVAPHLNKDLFADSPVGRATSQYSTPGRRAFRLMYDWWRSDKIADRLKFAGAFAGLVALGGSGAVPQTAVQSIARLAGAATGNNDVVEKTMANFDQLNVLRSLTGIDYSTNFGPDVFTGAMPALEAVENVGKQAGRAAIEGDYSKAAAAVFLETLSLFPKLGPFGYDVWESGLKDVEAAAQGAKKQYFRVGPMNTLRSVTINGYDYGDALRDWMAGGTNPKAFDEIQQVRQRSAEKADALKEVFPSR